MSVDHVDSTWFDSFVANDLQSIHHSEDTLRERLASHRAALDQFERCCTDLLSAARLLTATLRAGHTVLTLGNGGSAAEAQHFAAELVGRFRLERRAYPVIALTTDSSILTAVANDYGYAEVFARQVEAFARPGDLLIAFSTSGESGNAIQAAQVAREHGAAVVGMTGAHPCSLGGWADVLVQAPSLDTPTIQELHMMFTHVLCDIAESSLAASDEGGVA